MQDELAALRAQIGERHKFWNVLSKCPRMFDIFELIGQVADTTATVLIEGETGTGKEQLARAIHQASSPYRQGPFVPVHCAALPETLLESELFGHEKGAFTGAAAQRKGRFELAQGGTLFLDEVADIPMSMQVKLLRVLQEHCFERVGGNQTIEIDVRVIAATNRTSQGAGRGREVPGRPLLSTERDQDRPAPLAAPPGGYSAPGHLFRPEVHPSRAECRPDLSGGHGTAAGLRMAGKYPATRERGGASLPHGSRRLDSRQKPARRSGALRPHEVLAPRGHQLARSPNSWES